MYYPKSQITTNLYTNGGEYSLSTTGENYIGSYYLVSNGQRYTGKNPSDKPNILLTQPQESPNPEGTEALFPPKEIVIQNESYEAWDFENQEISQQYFRIVGNKVGSKRLLPFPYYPTPTSNDYKNGEFQRYFAKKTNELIYIEIDKTTYNKLLQQDPTIAFDLYNTISLPWNLIGKEKQVYQSNKKIVELAERENNWYGFTSYFKQEFLKYYNSIKENLFTSGGEYTTKDGKEYIGDYHIHPDKGPMVGAVHVSYPHDYLFPILSPTGSIEQPSTPLTPPTTPSYSPPSTSGGGGGY